MSEQLREGSYVDRWQLRRDGKLLLAETMRLGGDIAAKLARRAVAAGSVAVATVLIAPGDEALVARLREHAGQCRSEVGISAWNGFALVRFCAADAARLRQELVALLASLDGIKIPRLWLA
jgi:urease accessory protein